MHLILRYFSNLLHVYDLIYSKAQIQEGYDSDSESQGDYDYDVTDSNSALSTKYDDLAICELDSMFQENDLSHYQTLLVCIFILRPS
jgi:hypothetical protein